MIKRKPKGMGGVLWAGWWCAVGRMAGVLWAGWWCTIRTMAGILSAG